MKKTTLLLVLMAALWTMPTYGVRALRGFFPTTQSDGTTLQVEACGDEDFHYFRTADNVVLTFDGKDFCYARLQDDGLASTGIVAHELSLRSALEQRAVVTTAQLRPIEQPIEAVRAQRAAVPKRVRHITGTLRGLVILAAFADKPFKSENAREEWDEIINKPGYSNEKGCIGSVSDYFAAQSHGELQLMFDVVGPVTLPEPRAFYGGNTSGRGTDIRADQMVREACQLAADQVDFSVYDWDGNGSVEQVFVIYAGFGENEYTKDTDAIWPKKSSFSPKLTLNGVTVSSYVCSNELGYDRSSGSDTPKDRGYSGIGTICHEFSHCLNLPDLYDVGDSSPILDEWDLMDGGNYTNGGWSPPNYSAYERYICGWMELEELTENTMVRGLVPIGEENAKGYIHKNPANSKEIYILENRQQQGWDYYIPGHGLLVTHFTNFGSTTMRPNSSSGSGDSKVNNYTIEYVYADGNNYYDYITKRIARTQYDANGRSNLLTRAAYPFHDAVADTLNNTLTLHTTPALTFDGALINITEEEGLINFDYYLSTAEAEATGISPIHNVQRSMFNGATAVYDLQGRRVSNGPLTIDNGQLQPGIYIVGGRKVVIK